MSSGERLLDRARRFGRALIVGGGATLVDFALFSGGMRLLGMSPAAARLPALCAGASLQFFGNRSFTFRATTGSLPRQAWLFLIAELTTLLLNYSLFTWLVPRVQGIAPELVSFAGTFVTFVGFAYPLRRLVIFRLPPAASTGSEPRQEPG